MKNYVLKVIQDSDEEIKCLDKEASKKYVDLFLTGARSIYSDINYAAIQDDITELNHGVKQGSKVLIELLNIGDFLIDYEVKVYTVLEKQKNGNLKLFDIFQNKVVNVDYDFFLEVDRIIDNPII